MTVSDGRGDDKRRKGPFSAIDSRRSAKIRRARHLGHSGEDAASSVSLAFSKPRRRPRRSVVLPACFAVAAAFILVAIAMSLQQDRATASDAGQDAGQPQGLDAQAPADDPGSPLSKEMALLSSVSLSPGDSALLDIPIYCQFDDGDGGVCLYAGCEVTSLAMLLTAAGDPTTKEAVAAAVPKVPYIVSGEDGFDAGQSEVGTGSPYPASTLPDGWGFLGSSGDVVYGNPNDGFVGDIFSDGDGLDVGYSIYHGPIAATADAMLQGTGKASVDLTNQGFDAVLKEVKMGNPVWVITTSTFEPTDNWETWNTTSGPIDITWDVHSVVVTGFDDDHVYINNPYLTEPNEAVDRVAFEQAWEQLGSQAVVIRSVSS